MEAHLCVRNNSYLIFVRNFQKKNRNAVQVRSGPIRTLVGRSIRIGSDDLQ